MLNDNGAEPTTKARNESVQSQLCGARNCAQALGQCAPHNVMLYLFGPTRKKTREKAENTRQQIR